MKVNAVTMTTTGSSAAIMINSKTFFQGVGLIVTIMSGSANYDVEVSGDTVNWNKHDVLVNQATSQNSNLAFPVSWVRLHINSISGSVILNVIQTD